jgi:hypothetical protein
MVSASKAYASDQAASGTDDDNDDDGHDDSNDSSEHYELLHELTRQKA